MNHQNRPNPGPRRAPSARPQSTNHAPQSRSARPTQPRSAVRPTQRRAPARKNENPVLKVLKVIGLGLFMAVAAVGKLFSRLNRKLDVFRRGEASAAIVNTLVGGAVLIIALVVFALCKPGIDDSRARSLAAEGRADAAMKLVHSLERKNYDAEKLSDLRLSVAEGLIQSGRIAEAQSLIAELSEGNDRQALEQKATYAKAAALYDSGDYTAAAQLFYQLGDYGDSAGRYADCRCALAIEAYQSGSESTARSLLLDVPDVVTRISVAAVKVMGSEEAARPVLSAELFSAENLTRLEETMEKLGQARSDMPQGKIAAGWRHTLGLTADGRVLAVGDNSAGQLNVSEWSGITQVAAGAYHSVGLKSDGTVVACGMNAQQQCEVGTWTDIVAIAASTCDTIGLKSDGTVVACGMHSAKVSGWRNATHVTAGSYSLGCLYDKGAMMSSHPGAQMDLGVTLYDLSICGPISAGVLYDGSLISSFDGAPDWTEMASVTVCESGILGIDVNGQVRSHFYRSGDVVDFALPSAAVEIASSGTHHVVLCADGTVHAFGENDFGQCAVTDWRL